jgi:hypothetical protein
MANKKPSTGSLPPVKVPADALHRVLMALLAPMGSSQIRELQATRTVDPALCDAPNPINVLTEAYNAWLKENEELIEKKKT